MFADHGIFRDRTHASRGCCDLIILNVGETGVRDLMWAEIGDAERKAYACVRRSVLSTAAEQSTA